MRLNTQFCRPFVSSCHLLLNLAPAILDIYLDSFKNLSNFRSFKSRIKKHKTRIVLENFEKIYTARVQYA